MNAVRLSLVSLSVAAFGSPAVADPSDAQAYIFSARSGWNSHEADAKADALSHAREHLAAYLRNLPSPVRSLPTDEQLWNEHVFSTLPVQREKFGTPINAEMYKVEIEVEITPEQLRKLRAEDRVRLLFRWGGVALAGMILAAAFFRLDDWAKGYLTKSLAAGAVAILVLVAVAAWLI